MRELLFILTMLSIMPAASSAKQAFKPTEPGSIELKTLPAGRLLESTGKGDYFNQSNSLFGPLFRYISRNNISMTTPVEAKIDPGTMYFWVAENQVDKATEETDRVRVVDVPERLVAAAGARGSYSEENFKETREELVNWLQQQAGVKAVGEPFAVYWNGPMTPWFMKQFEVMVEVTKLESNSKSPKED